MRNAIWSTLFLLPCAIPFAAEARPQLIEADELLGRRVQSSDGQQEGTIRYVAISPTTARVEMVLVQFGGAAGKPPQSLAVLPWHALGLDQARPGPIVLTLPDERIRNAPRLSAERLAELTTAKLRAQVSDYFALPFARQDEDALLLGQEYFRAFQPPAMATVQDLRDAEVKTPDGEVVGRIEDVAIDAGEGRVAYVVIDKAASADDMLVPMLALQWVSPSTYLLPKGAVDLSRPQVAERDSVLDEDNLFSLYESFGIEPYWR